MNAGVTRIGVTSGTGLVPALGISREVPSSVSSPPRSPLGSHPSPFLGTGFPVDREGCSLSLTALIISWKSGAAVLFLGKVFG